MQAHLRLLILATCLSCLGLICPGSTCFAGVEIEESPLFERTLDDAVQDLKEPVTATAPWKTSQIGGAIADFVLGSPAEAAVAANVTMQGERTRCKQDGKNYSICIQRTQKCLPTVHSRTKTQCNGPSDKSVCKDMGTRCPGTGDTNQCVTNMPGQITHCADMEEATVCGMEATRCQRQGDLQKCLTVFGTTGQTTVCASGQTVPTLCEDEATACSRARRKICKTTKTSDRTSCPTSSHITVCTNAGTLCTGDELNEGCEFANVSLADPVYTAGADQLVVVESTQPGYFTDEFLTTLEFSPAGPQVIDVTLFDDREAHFSVTFPDLPTELQSYDVIVNNGSGLPDEVNPVLVEAQFNVPATDTPALWFLTAALLGVAALFLWRRRTT